MELSILAKNLLFLRKNKGWKQSEIEYRCGIKQRNWSNWENAGSQPDINNLITISNLFGMAVDSLLKEDISKNTHLIDKKTFPISEKFNTPKSTPFITPKYEFTEEEPEIPVIKKQIDLLILEQLNLLT